jgi:sulfur relay (sulfurtransferase) DsrC/TusE family protein
MDIVKYLRREKAILTTKTEVLQSESARLKSNLELAQKELAESRSVRSWDLIFFLKNFYVELKWTQSSKNLAKNYYEDQL